jgi:gluconokinase
MAKTKQRDMESKRLTGQNAVHGLRAPLVVLVTGVSGSGKTTIGRLLAEELGWNFSDADEFHSATNRNKLTSGVPLSDEDRRPWLDRLRSAIATWVGEARSTVLACSALKTRFRRDLTQGLEDRVRFVYLKGSLDLIERRLAGRDDHFMHRDLLASQFEMVEESDEALVVDINDTPDRIVAHIRSDLGL